MLRKINTPTTVVRSLGPGPAAWLVAALAVFAAMSGPAVSGRWHTGDDLGCFHLPLRAFYAEQLSRGETFDWMPGLFCGFYMTGEGQAGTYHPFHWLAYRFLPLRAAFACELLATYPFLFAGMWLFLRRRRIRPEAAALGSLAFTFGSFNLLHFVHPNAVAVMAHLPWLLWCIDVGLGDAGRRSQFALAGVAILTASQLLLGYPQYVWFSLLTEAAYVLFLTCQVRRWGRVAAAVAVGVALGAVQLLPTVDALGHSARSSADPAYLNSGSLHPLNLVQLVAPYLFTHRVAGQNTHELGLYLGAVPLLLVLWLPTQWSRLGRFRRLAAAAAAFGLVALLLAFGQHAPLYRIQQWLPLVGGFRFPCRYVVVVQFCGAVLAAVAFATLVRRHSQDAPASWRSLAPLAVAFGASLAAAVAGVVLRDLPEIAPSPLVLAGPLAIGAAAALLALAARGRRWAFWGLIVLMVADLGAYGLSYSVYPQAETYDEYLASADVPPREPGKPGEPGAPRVLADLLPFDEPGIRTGNQLLLAGFSRADGYAGLEPFRRLDYGKVAALRVAGVAWVRLTEHTRTIEGLVDGEGPWRRVPRPLPRVRLVATAVPSDCPARDIEGIELESAALVEEPLALDAGPPGEATLLADRPGRLRIAVYCPDERLLVVAESHHSGWEARVDGRLRPLLRVNGDFLGCVVRPGDREVALDFRPPSLRLGKLVSCLSLVLVVALAVCYRAGSSAIRKLRNEKSVVASCP